MRNIEKKIFAGPKKRNTLFANTICIKKMFVETSDKLLINISSKYFISEKKNKSNKILL